MRITRQNALLLAVVASVAAIVAAVWARQQYAHEAELQVAREFVALLRAGDYEQAFELTTKSKVWGHDHETFNEFSPRQMCGAFSVSEVFPRQTNGNRLKRQLSGQDTDMQEVNVQYEGECFFRVTLRRGASGKWQVLKFGSHAG